MKPSALSPLPAPRRERGAALLIILTIIGIGAAWLLVSALKSNPQIERDKITADALAKAKDALIGYAATYRDTHPDTGNYTDKVFGYLPCPDTNNDGTGDPPCGNKDVTVVGRLPWKELGLPPLRDSAGECLWYIVSGRAKNNPPTDELNWDTVGQVEVQDASGQILAAANTHDTPWAVIAAPGSATGTQDRTSAGASECGGSINAAAYLESLTLNPAVGGVSTLVLATNDSAKNGTNNDRGLWIASREIFERVKKRSDFASDIGTLLTDLKTSLDAATPPRVTAFNTASTAGCPVTDGPADQKKDYFRCNWNNNLKFAENVGITVNGAPCDAVLIFAGERTASQVRLTATDKANAANYLEGVNATSFPGGTTYSGISAYTATTASADIVACITGTGGTTVSFSNPTQFSKFEIAGAGVTVDPITQTATIDVAGGSGGGCLWFPDLLTLNGKILRTYYEFKFAYPDPPGGSDYGYGFTLSFLQGDAGKPTTCGSQSTMGVIPASTLPFSLFVETDIRRESANGEPVGTSNHTAIMANGNIVHSATNGNLTIACNGTAAGCNYSLSNQFEESPATLLHNQRVEIHSGYNSTCTATGGTYSLVKVWVDCTACNNTGGNFTAAAPTVTRCISLDSSMSNIYFGFTAGFSSSGGQVQGVTLQKLELRVE
ncbi:MAG: hypothetical protein Q8O38_15505 [Sulfurimicrobium sp.]|nr:hypothetical protein [Sulfurimicrobium sp.]